MSQEAEVLFDYEKTQDDELTLRVGDIIQDVVTADEGWCEGSLNGKRGLFPDNFVKVRPAKVPSPAQPPSESKPPVVREGGGAIKSRRVKVAFSYAAESADELSLQPGQIVEVIAEEEEGWYRGRLNDKVGVFPNNFVEAIPTPNEPTPPPPEPVRPEEPPPPKQPPQMGHKLFPSINPALARAQLRSSTPEKKAPPPPVSAIPKPEKPPEKKAPVEFAKVVFDYNAENDDELTIKTGDVVEIISKDVGQDGWWMVKLGDKTGLVPDNFVEILPASAAPPPIAKAKHLPPKETPAPPAPTKPLPPRSSSTSSTRPPPPHSDPTRTSSVSRHAPPQPQRHPPPTEQKSSIAADEEEDDEGFGVPHTDPLDSSAVKNRPKKTSRPPSRSNILMDEGNSSEPPPEPKAPTPQGGGGGGGLTPWQAELQKRKVHKPPPMAPGNKPHPPTAPKKSTVKPPEKPVAAAKPTPKPQAATKPHVEPTSHPPRDVPSPHPPPSVSPASTPTHIPIAAHVPIAAAPPANNEWKAAYENLRDDFEKFKEFVQQQFATLTDDLDEERKHWRGLEVDIDRLKKKPSYPK